MKRTLLITGGSGLLGLNWALQERTRDRVVLGMHTRAVTLDGVESRRVHLATVEQATRTIDEVKPHVVVHTAGMTSVEQCETDPARAREVNVGLATNVALACAQYHVPLVHISTDHLFGGHKPLVSEEQVPAPVNVYAATKAEAEHEVTKAWPAALIVRTNFYAWGPAYRPSFSDRIIQALRTGTPIELFSDVFFTPILVETLVTSINRLLATETRGIYNVVGDERLSKYAFGCILARIAGLDASSITEGSIKRQASLVRRPPDMSLSNEKVCRKLGYKLGSAVDGIKKLLAQERAGQSNILQIL